MMLCKCELIGKSLKKHNHFVCVNVILVICFSQQRALFNCMFTHVYLVSLGHCFMSRALVYLPLESTRCLHTLELRVLFLWAWQKLKGTFKTDHIQGTSVFSLVIYNLLWFYYWRRDLVFCTFKIFPSPSIISNVMQCFFFCLNVFETQK